MTNSVDVKTYTYEGQKKAISEIVTNQDFNVDKLMEIIDEMDTAITCYYLRDKELHMRLGKALQENEELRLRVRGKK